MYLFIRIAGSFQLDSIAKMNDNLHHSQLSDTSSHNGSSYDSLELEKMNPLGELNFFFGERSSGNGQQQRSQQNHQQQPGKRSMDDVLKKLSSKMHISHSPVDEMDPFNKDRYCIRPIFQMPSQMDVLVAQSIAIREFHFPLRLLLLHRLKQSG